MPESRSKLVHRTCGQCGHTESIRVLMVGKHEGFSETAERVLSILNEVSDDPPE